jgi:hypothetical protein
MASRRNVLQEDDILCELYADRSSDVSDYSDNESMDSEKLIVTLTLIVIVTVTSPLVHINNFDLQLLLVTLKQVQ